MVTRISLSVLDQVPIRSGSTPEHALRETQALARTCDRLGYRRYWLAEHHGSSALSCASPEILVPQLAAQTERIRVGSGGVMLSHYSPLKVAESFRLLEALYPGRIDLGIGRAPGSDQLTAAALASRGGGFAVEQFPVQLRDLLGFLAGELPAGHPFRSVRAVPAGESMPEVWLLGSGTGSAQLAAYFGCAFSHAHFINAGGTAEALELYRREFQPGLLERPEASLGVAVICADSEQEADRLSLSRYLWWIKLTKGDYGPFPSVEEALAYDYSPQDQAVLEKLRRRSIWGTPEQVREQLSALARQHEVAELVILTITHDPGARLRSYELLAEAFELTRGACTGQRAGEVEAS